MAILDENFDGIGDHGDVDTGPNAQPRIINGWTFTLLDAGGNQSSDQNSFVDVLKDPSQSSLIDDGDDGVARLNGPQAYAAVIKATDGNEFRFVSFKAESGLQDIGGAAAAGLYRLVGYRDGVAVDGAIHNFVAPPYGNFTTVAPEGAAWHFVDELRIVRQDGLPDIGIYIDDLDIEAATLPHVLSVSAVTANGSYGVGDVITLKVTFNEPVTVTGMPLLTLETGATDRVATYVGGSGNTELSFEYTVQSNDVSVDLDYASTTALALNGGTINNGSGVSAVLDVPTPGGPGSIAASSSIIIDGVSPTIGTIVLPVNGTYSVGATLDFGVTFSEAVVVTGTPRLAIALDTGGTVYANYIGGSNSNALVFQFTVISGLEDKDGIELTTVIDLNGGALKDAAGNQMTALTLPDSPHLNILVDSRSPTIAAVQIPADKTYNAGENLDFNIKFSEAVTVTGAPRIGITLNTGGVVYTDYVSGSGTEELAFRFTVLPGLQDTDGITLAPNIDLNGGTIEDAVGHSLVDLALVPPPLNNVRVDSIGGGVGGNDGGGEGGGNVPKPTTPNSGTIIDATPSADGSPVVITGGAGVDEVRIAGSVVLGARLENAVLTGTGNFSVEGNDLDNIIYGNAGDNTIVISGGNDFIDGGLGNNTVVLTGPASDYSISVVGGVAQVTNLVTGDVSTIANVSMLQFTDGSQPLFATGQALVSGFYQAFLGRPLDLAGFEFWMGRSLEGTGPLEIVQHFVNAPEFIERTASLSPEELVRLLYANFLQRPEDSAGQDYWIEAIVNGMSYGEVAANFVLSEELAMRIDELLDRNDWLGIV